MHLRRHGTRRECGSRAAASAAAAVPSPAPLNVTRGRHVTSLVRTCTRSRRHTPSPRAARAAVSRLLRTSQRQGRVGMPSRHPPRHVRSPAAEPPSAPPGRLLARHAQPDIRALHLSPCAPFPRPPRPPSRSSRAAPVGIRPEAAPGAPVHVPVPHRRPSPRHSRRFGRPVERRDASVHIRPPVTEQPPPSPLQRIARQCAAQVNSPRSLLRGAAARGGSVGQGAAAEPARLTLVSRG